MFLTDQDTRWTERTTPISMKFYRQLELVRAAPPLACPGSGEQVGVCLDVEGGRGGAGHREVADQHQPALNCQDF